jgi:endonuclease/exonuclease/phosphatase family metal-dependent hydrolase
MSYNLHQGFSRVTGDMTLEEIAKVIEEEGADIVALQEVSRAWVVSGSVDMLVWLSQRLEMPYVWGPASDDVWGNAVLSRYPLSGAETYPMPNNDELILQRSYTTVMADLGAGEALRIIATHLHSWRQDSHKRIPQVRAILEAWDGAPRTVILGDLNAEPDAPEMQLLRDAGLVDTFVAAEAQEPGHTTLWGTPPRRIDYIWLTPALGASDFSTGESRASDHLPVTVTVTVGQ